MDVTMSNCEATARQRGQRGRLRHNNQIEAVAGSGWQQLAMDVNGNDRWQQAAMVTGGSSRGSGSGTFGGSGGRRLQW
jgi:hypothetical protein